MVLSIQGIMPSEQVRETLKAQGDPVLLGFSRGKDSIAAWLALREAGVDVIPFHLYRVPDIEFEEENLQYFEEFFGTHILRLPHPAFWRWMRGYLHQPPERCSVIDAADLEDITYEDIVGMIREDYNIPNAWYCDGVRAADSPVRRIAIKSHGVMKPKNRKAHPVWDWQIADIREAINSAGVKWPPDYEWFGRSFDGLDRRFLEPLSKYAPKDYAKVLEWFPLAELELTRS